MKPHVWIIDDEPGICASLSLALKRNMRCARSAAPCPHLRCLSAKAVMLCCWI